MSDDEIDLDDIERRMSGAVESLKHEFSGLRTGRASTSLLDSVTVDVYGASMPLKIKTKTFNNLERIITWKD